MSDEGTLNAMVPIFRKREGTSWSESGGRGLAHLYSHGIGIKAEKVEGTGLGSHDRIANSMSRTDVRTGLEGLVGAGVFVDPVEQHTSTIERLVGVGAVVPSSALVGPVQQDSISPLRNDNVHYVYQRLEGRGPFHSPGDFEDFVAMLFHSQRRQYPLNLSTHGPSVPARSTGESQPDQPCHRTHEPPRHTLVPKTPVSSLQPSPIGRDDISASVKACPLNHTLYSQHPPVCLG